MGQSWEAIVVVGRISQLDMQIAIFQPTEPFEFFTERRKSLLPQWISLHAMQQDADASQSRRLLRARDQRPGRGAADKANKFAPSHCPS